MSCLFLAGTFLLWKIFWKPLVNIMETRENKIRSDITAAEEARVKMEQIRDEYSSKMKEIERKATEIIAEATRLAKERAEKLESNAQEEILRHKEMALAELERERVAAIASLRSEVGDLALTVARTVLKREVKAEDHKRFVDDFLANVERSPDRN